MVLLMKSDVGTFYEVSEKMCKYWIHEPNLGGSSKRHLFEAASAKNPRVAFFASMLTWHC